MTRTAAPQAGSGQAGGAVRLTERALQAHVVDAAEKLGFLCYHPWISVNSSRGYPDLCLARDGRLIYAELKSDTGEVTASQQRWLDEFAAVPCCEVHLWRPADWFSGRIVAILAGVDDADTF